MNQEKRKAFIVNFLYFGILAMLIYLVIKYALPMVMPFAVGFVIAYFLHRPSVFLARTLHINVRIVSVLIVLVFFCTVGLLITLASIRAFSMSKSLVMMIPVFYQTYVEPVVRDLFTVIEEWTKTLAPSLESTLNSLFNQAILSLGESVSGLSVSAMRWVSGAASSLPSVLIKHLLLIISTFFIALDYDKLTGFCLRQLSGKSGAMFMQIKEYIIGTLFVCIRSYAIIMSITFVELSIGFTIIGLEYALPIAFGIAIFDILPVLGTGGIMLPWAVITAIRGDIPLALSLLAVYVVVTIIRNIIEPKIVGAQLGLHPVVTLVSMFVGTQLFGVLGLFGFPICLSLLRHLNDTGAVKIFK